MVFSAPVQLQLQHTCLLSMCLNWVANEAFDTMLGLRMFTEIHTDFENLVKKSCAILQRLTRSRLHNGISKNILKVYQMETSIRSMFWII